MWNNEEHIEKCYEILKEKFMEFTMDKMIEGMNSGQGQEGFKAFQNLMMYHRCALREVETKLRVLDEEFSIMHDRNPIQSISTRIKKPISIVEKLKRRGLAINIENMESELNDIAGIRVVCAFIEDIYNLARMLSMQDDIQVVERKDYIEHPKPNGYRSLHLIIDIPIFLSDEKKSMRVEVQFRTIAMDFWASLEHQLKYKKEIGHADEIANQLKECADVITQTDEKMQKIRYQIEEL